MFHVNITSFLFRFPFLFTICRQLHESFIPDPDVGLWFWTLLGLRPRPPIIASRSRARYIFSPPNLQAVIAPLDRGRLNHIQLTHQCIRVSCARRDPDKVLLPFGRSRPCESRRSKLIRVQKRTGECRSGHSYVIIMRLLCM